MMITKMHGVLGLFVLLVLILMVKPIFYNNMYNNVLGRVVLIAILLFFATNSVTLGLLVALIIIIGTNMFFVEGMENNNKDNVKNNDKNNVKSSAKNKNATASVDDSINNAISQLNGKGRTIGDDSQSINTSTKTIQVTTSKNKGTGKDKSNGIDRFTLAETMKPTVSNTVHVDKGAFLPQGDVSAAEPDALTEGFKSWASA